MSRSLIYKYFIRMETLVYHVRIEELMPEKQKVTIIEQINKNRWGSWRNSKPSAKNEAGE